MNNGFYYQVLINLARMESPAGYSRSVRDMIGNSDLTEVNQLNQQLLDGLINSPLHETEGASFFAFSAEQSLLFALYRGDFVAFGQFSEILDNRFPNIKLSKESGFDKAGWAAYFDFIKAIGKRIKRFGSIEEFEQMLDEIDWDNYDPAFIPRISGLVGFLYLNEKDESRHAKSRFWIQKAATESEESFGLLHNLNLAGYYLGQKSKDAQARLETILSKIVEIAQSAPDKTIARLYKAAVFELKAKILLNKIEMYDDQSLKIGHNLESLRELEFQMKQELRENGLPGFAMATLQLAFAERYANLAGLENQEGQYGLLMAMANDNSASAVKIANRMNDEWLSKYCSLVRMEMLAGIDPALTDKEIKEMAAFYRKNDNYLLLTYSVKALSEYYKREKSRSKTFEPLFDLLKTGQKRWSEGGMELVTNAFALLNDVFLFETEQPGVSWMVDKSGQFFEKIIEIIVELDGKIKEIDRSLFDRFRKEYVRFMPVSHYNIKNYFRYQMFNLEIARLDAILRDDTLTLEMCTNSLNEFKDQNNPLHFITADWDDFKDVPNMVRNNTVNKCITISKGDLPLAAEHLDFSYRNLRSYITFNEVNRLGFFLDLVKTRNRQLEHGIRLMFHDLYKKGTIFEVVFDMPRFLVETANEGFASLDMEEALDIKGTTAKKYIKIMMEMEMIKHEKSVGRKHFYRLRKENVMNRLGSDHKVLIG